LFSISFTQCEVEPMKTPLRPLPLMMLRETTKFRVGWSNAMPRLRFGFARVPVASVPM